MSRRIATAVAIAAAAALALVGCSGSGGGSTSEKITFDKDTKAKISFSWWGNDDRAARFEKAIAGFNKEYPNVEVVRNFNAWGDYWTARNTEAAGHALPDVVMMDAGYLGEYSSKSLLRDLTPYRDNLLPLKGVTDNVLGSGTIDGKLQSVPLGTNAWSMMYNKDVLDKLGIAYPTGDMTWDEFDAFIKKVDAAGASSDPKIYGSEDYTGGFPNFIYHLMQKKNAVFTKEGKPAFTKKDVTSYLDSASSLRKGGDFYPIDRSIALSPSGGFLAGETAVWFNFSTTVLQAMTDAGTENIGMVTPPLDEGKKSHILAPKPSMLLSVSANSKQPQAAAALVNYLVTSPDVAKIFGTSLGTPATEAGRDAVDQQPADTVNLDYLDSVSKQLTASYPILPAGYGTIEAKWSDLSQQLQYGQITSKQFADELFSEMSMALGS
ncbi:extracellular solute-binding protein [Leifsonia sp. NPDC080035]|uniref:Extracellular solute-binding protein n=1 Tax=Leifsonia sp. NPDC080035 TaxID=3143936 RepID=A0AAU7G6I8_9MICO